METVEEFIKIESIFVRHRNALVIRGQFTPIYTDYYLHLMQHGIRHPEDLDQMLKDAMAMLALHLVARPWAETIAWTVNLRAPRVNLFVTGGSRQEAVTGRVFIEDVREPDRNFFYSQTTSPNLAPPRWKWREEIRSSGFPNSTINPNNAPHGPSVWRMKPSSSSPLNPIATWNGFWPSTKRPSQPSRPPRKPKSSKPAASVSIAAAHWNKSYPFSEDGRTASTTSSKTRTPSRSNARAAPRNTASPAT